MKTAEAQAPAVDAVIFKKEKRKRLLIKLIQQKYLYLMILPGCIYFLLFKYVPMWGIVIAFQDYQPFLGILGSEWVGLKHFIRLFTEPTFFLLLKKHARVICFEPGHIFPGADTAGASIERSADCSL